ncbi:MAG: RluA family pseudouridine synthase [Bacteroidales bacterium]|nr:RluA family pseudouridine synthase [Bacteroidales bacterium]
MDILYEDNHIIAVNKIAGQIVQGDNTGDVPLSDMLKNFIKGRDNKPGNVFLGVPHRIDRPVSGVVLFAKTSKALTRLSEMFRTKDAHKTYWAVVANKPPKDEDTLVDYIFRNVKQNKSYVVDEKHADAKKSSLSYKVIGRSERYYLLEIDLHTGRHHQIRCQLAEIGCPIRGDLKYGYPRSNKNGGINLHARKITFIHPVKKEEMLIEAPLPDENIWSIF